MGWRVEGPGWVMRVLMTLSAFILVFVIGVKTEWISVSNAALITNEGRAAEDRGIEAAVLGQTRLDATSGELIDAAVLRGEISSEQALLYGVYLACGDPRLPARFHGQETAAPATNILWEADVDWASLSPDVQQALRNLFIEGPTQRPGLACASDIARLKDDPAVWWRQAFAPEDSPIHLATR